MRGTGFAMRFVIVAATAVALSATIVAQKGKPAAGGPTPIRVDGNVIKGYIDWMSDAQREGRKTLTPGYEKSAEWVAAKFREWGLKPAGDNGTFLQDVPITGARSAFAWTTGIPEMTVDGRTFLVRDNAFTLDTASTPGAQANGEVVFVGYGISAPAKGLDEYAGLDVKNKIVLALTGSPKDAPAARTSFGPATVAPASTEAWTDESTDQAKIMNAYNKGAAAVLLFAPEGLATAGGRGGAAAAPAGPAAAAGRRRATLDPAAFKRPFFIVTDVDASIFRQVMYRDPVALQESPRGFVARIDAIRRDIREKKPRSTATGVKAQIKGYATTTWYGETWKNNVSHNVVGKIDGTDPKLKTQVIVIGGHLDHLGVTNGVVMNGADDDASGAATVMEMARLIATNAATIRPKRTIIFAAWCGEEEGLLGSNWWGEHPTAGIKMDDVVADFNNDMVGLGDHVGAPGGLNFPVIWQVIMKNQDPDVAKVVTTSTAGPGGSDYSTFIEKGIESIALMSAGGVGHPDYHDAGDDVEKIDPEMLRKNGQFVLQGVINVANETAVNLVVPDRLHLYNAMRMALLNLNEGRGGGGRGGRGGQAAAPAPVAPRMNVALSEPSAFYGNPALVDVAAKFMGVGRVDVPARGDGIWFTANGLTVAGRTALKSFEANGIVLNLVNPSAALLSDMLDAATRGFIVSGLTAMPDAATAARIKAKRALVAVEFDVATPQAVAAKLIDFKKAAGDSGNLLLVTREPSAGGGRGEAPVTEWKTSRLDEAKQQLYLALIKAGWTKDEIYAMVGVTPPAPGGPGGGRGGGAGLGGNLAKLSPAVPTT